MRTPLLPFVVLLLAACGRSDPAHVVRGVYHWSNSMHLGRGEQDFVDTHAVRLVYWKVLDIDWNEANHAHPVSIVRPPASSNRWEWGGRNDAWDGRMELVPVVFITNYERLLRTKAERDAYAGIVECTQYADFIARYR